jgi:hypothetical protein
VTKRDRPVIYSPHGQGIQGYCPNNLGWPGYGTAGSAVDARWDNLFAGWKMDETSGTRADVLGTYTLTDNNTVTSDTGKLDTAAKFVSGNDEYLSNASAMSALDDQWTVSMWVYRTSDVVGKTLVSNGNFASPLGVTIRCTGNLVGDCQIYLPTNDTDITTREASGAGVVAKDAWTHIVVTYDGTVAVAADRTVLYTDNTVRVTDTTGTPPASVNVGDRFWVGKWSGINQQWDGRIDSLHIFSETKDSTWVAGMYNGGSGVEYPD